MRRFQLLALLLLAAGCDARIPSGTGDFTVTTATCMKSKTWGSGVGFDKLHFRVNFETQTVVAIGQGGDLRRLRDCVVFDQNNWHCDNLREGTNPKDVEQRVSRGVIAPYWTGLIAVYVPVQWYEPYLGTASGACERQALFLDAFAGDHS